MRRLLAFLFTIGPFVAGTVAALSARRDLRMLAMALTATVVTRIALAAGRRRTGGVTGIVAFVTSALAAGVVAVLAGARGVFGVVAVAIVLAAFATVGALLGAPAPTVRSASADSPV